MMQAPCIWAKTRKRLTLADRGVIRGGESDKRYGLRLVKIQLVGWLVRGGKAIKSTLGNSPASRLMSFLHKRRSTFKVEMCAQVQISHKGKA